MKIYLNIYEFSLKFIKSCGAPSKDERAHPLITLPPRRKEETSYVRVICITLQTEEASIVRVTLPPRRNFLCTSYEHSMHCTSHK